MPSSELPSYEQLPVQAGLPRGSSWGVWPDDRLGCLNLLGREQARRGASCVRTGASFGLNLELELPSPPLFGRPAMTHEVHQRPGGLTADDTVAGNTQSSSQWDGFRHVRHPRHGAYGGLPEAEHGVNFWSRRGIVGRGVLADVAAWRASVGRPVQPDSGAPITVDDLLATLRWQSVAVETGDILLVRTGWLAWYRGLDEAGRTAYAANIVATGLEPSERTAAALWDLHISCLGADNPAIETWPPRLFTLPPDERAEALAAVEDPAVTASMFLHLNLLPLLGLPLGELFDLDALAVHCAEARTYDFLVTSAPLNLDHGVATPPNILAVC